MSPGRYVGGGPPAPGHSAVLEEMGLCRDSYIKVGQEEGQH